MAEKRRLNLSLSMASPCQREAWKILRAIPSGQRTYAVCRMLLEHRSQQELLDAVRVAVREEMCYAQITPRIEQKEKPEAGSVNDDVLGFLFSLQNDTEQL